MNATRFAPVLDIFYQISPKVAKNKKFPKYFTQNFL